MQFRYFEQPMAYGEGPESWQISTQVPYLYEISQNGKTNPPAGMRSAVPLGGLGSGTVELRADGSFHDWNIYNNSPAGGTKVQIDDTFFGIWSRVKGGSPASAALRTHPPAGLPGVEQIEYSGAFPVSRLSFQSPEQLVSVELFSYSEFCQRDSDTSATPAAIFTFVLHNPTRQSREVSLLFLANNYTGGRATNGSRIVFQTDGDTPTSGSIALKAKGNNVELSSSVANDPAPLWREFSANGIFRGSVAEPGVQQYGALAAKTEIGPGESRTITFILAWYLPYRPYLHQVPGNYYTTLFTSAEDVADRVLGRLERTWSDIHAWQQTVFDNSLPGWLQDALINSVATMYKTSLRFRDGRMMQWESFSCSGLNPLHIDFYRVLPYAFFFPDLEKRMLAEHAASEQGDGFIPEQLTTGCSAPQSELRQPGGRQMGGSATDFLLGAWQIYAWTGDKQYLDSIWKKVKCAAAWQLLRSADFGLPRDLETTYDWWGFAKKDLVSYNAFLYLASLLAAEKLALVEDDEELAAQYRQAFAKGQQSLVEHLWTGHYFRSWWESDKSYPDALHADTLYGQLWAFILDLGLTADAQQLQAHLASEQQLNASPYGLKVMRRADPEHPERENAVPVDGRSSPSPRDNLVWQAGSLDWCSLELYLGGGARASLDEAKKVIGNWSDHLCDQWNYTDLTTAWNGYPWCNSHYARQVILWSIPLALSGQHYFAPEGRLSFNPKTDFKTGAQAPVKLPFFTPTASGTLEILRAEVCRLTVHSGSLELQELRVGRAVARRAIRLRASISMEILLQQDA